MANTQKFLEGLRIQGRSDDSVLTAVPNTSWKILGRYDPYDGTPPTITAKDNLMVFLFIKRPNSGSANIKVCFNDDTSGNSTYAYRTKIQNTRSN